MSNGNLTLYDVNKILHQVGNLIGEDENLLTGFLAFIYGRRHVAYRGFAGSGKSATANAIWSMVEEPIGLELQAGSDKVLWNMVGSIREARLLYAREYQKFAQNVDAKELIKSFGEDKNFVRDRSKNVGGEWEQERITLEPRPVLTTLADENEDAKIDAEVGRRCVMLYADPSSDQTDKVIHMKTRKFSAPWKEEKVSEEMIELLKRSVLDVCVTPDLPQVACPGFESAFADKIPKTFHQARSVIDHFQDIVSATTRFYKNNRIQYDGYLLSTPSDVFEAYCVYKTVMLNNALQLQNLGDKVLLAFPQFAGEAEDEHMLSTTQVMQELSHQGLTLPRDKVQAVISTLLVVGFIEEDATIKPVKYYRGPMSKVSTALAIDWNDVVSVMLKHAKETLPEEVAREYGRKVAETMVVVHPVTGGKFNLADLKAAADPTMEKAKKIKTRTDKARESHKTFDKYDATNELEVEVVQSESQQNLGIRWS